MFPELLSKPVNTLQVVEIGAVYQIQDALKTRQES